MITLAPLPLWAEIVTALLIVIGSSLTLIGTVGLLRLRNFYDRVHAPSLGATLGLACVLLASMLYFWASGTRAVSHEVLIAIFVTATTPVTMLLLVNATLYRDRLEGTDPLATKPVVQTKDVSSAPHR